MDEIYTLSPEDVKAMLPKRIPDSHKGTYGTVLVLGGAKNMAGALLFSAEAAYRTGCGLVHAFTVEENRQIVQVKVPEAVLVTYEEGKPEEACELLKQAMKKATVFVAGPGLGQSPTAAALLKTGLENFAGPVLVDADGLNIMSKHLDWLKNAAGRVVITPHLKEMEQLTGEPVASIKQNKAALAKRFATEHNIVVVLKDSQTVVACEKPGIYKNTVGDNGMATGGSGDVLSGIIGGLMAQGAEPFEAAKLGCLLHGMAGREAARELGSYGMLARDIVRAIPRVMI